MSPITDVKSTDNRPNVRQWPADSKQQKFEP